MKKKHNRKSEIYDNRTKKNTQITKKKFYFFFNFDHFLKN